MASHSSSFCPLRRILERPDTGDELGSLHASVRVAVLRHRWEPPT